MEDRHGRAVLVAVAKLTFWVSPTGHWMVLDPGSPVRSGDEFYEDKRYAIIQYPSDYADEKPGTDVIFVGTAYPPESPQLVTEHDVSVRVGLLYKAVRVYGPRVFQAAGIAGVTPGRAQPLRPTPLRYDLAWGGVDDTDPEKFAIHRRNPAGIGFMQTRRRMVGAWAPQLEIPTSLVDKGTEPAGFGAIGTSWEPRAGYAGTADEPWRLERAPVHPEDFDQRFYCCAHPDLRSATPLHGDEPVEVLGATPEGVWRFQLPRYPPQFSVTRQGVETELDTHLDTFLIDADERRVELTWRASAILPRKAELLERMTIRQPEGVPVDRITEPDALSQAPARAAPGG